MRTALGVVLVLMVLAGAGGYLVLQAFDAAGPLETARTVQIPRGGLDGVANALAAQSVIDSPLRFRAAAAATGRQGALHAGELEMPAHASLRQVLTVLRMGKPIQHRLTIPEGLSAAQVAVLIERSDALEGDTVVPEEGMMLPETYSFERGATRAGLVERGRQMMARALDRAWSQRRPDLPLASAREALALASIVERETARPDERAHVAAVYLNRLRLGMKLQSDPTVIYGTSGGMGVQDHPITRAELDRDDPYNTYRNTGLPPGPICMPGVAAITAATQPAASDDLYFVADGTGGHAFARTNEEHLRNVARWREIERARRGLSAP